MPKYLQAYTDISTVDRYFTLSFIEYIQFTVYLHIADLLLMFVSMFFHVRYLWSSSLPVSPQK